MGDTGKDYEDIWICMVEIAPGAAISKITKEFEGYVGAVVNTLCKAQSSQDAHGLIAETLDELGLKLVAIHDLETFQERLKSGFADAEIMNLADQVGEGNPILFEQFHGWGH